MTDPLSWTISLGQWAGTRVRIHLSLVAFLAITLVHAALAPGGPVWATAAWMVLYLAALAWHEAGHAAAAWWLGVEPEDVRLWPLGNLVGPTREPRSVDAAKVAAAGPLLNLATFLVCAVVLNVGFRGAQIAWSPFGNGLGTGAPLAAAAVAVAGKAAAARTPLPDLTAAWAIGWFGYLNIVLFWANLLPALPFDAGRMLRTWLANPTSGLGKDSWWAPYIGRVTAGILVAVGLVRFLLFRELSQAGALIGMAVMMEYLYRVEARLLEDGGFFDDGVFGYDFSEGYTSLEASAAKVRPYRESALRRWRRRRSEGRRLRRQAREAAQDRRMDEILQKLHSQGRSSLTDEETRFLVRVSRKLRNRSKPT